MRSPTGSRQQHRRGDHQHRDPPRRRPARLQPRRLRRGRADAAPRRARLAQRPARRSCRRIPGCSRRSACSAPTSCTPTAAAPTPCSTPDVGRRDRPRSSARWRSGSAPTLGAGATPIVRRSFDGRLIGQSWETPFIERTRTARSTRTHRGADRRFHDEYERRYGNRFETFPVAGRHLPRPAGRADRQGRLPASCRPAATRRSRRARSTIRHLDRAPLEAAEYRARRSSAPALDRGPGGHPREPSTTFVAAGQLATVGRPGRARHRTGEATMTHRIRDLERPPRVPRPLRLRPLHRDRPLQPAPLHRRAHVRDLLTDRVLADPARLVRLRRDRLGPAGERATRLRRSQQPHPVHRDDDRRGPQHRRGVRARALGPGDVIIANDPYRTGTHVNDVLFIRPVFHDGLVGRSSPSRPTSSTWADRCPAGSAARKQTSTRTAS